MGLIAGWWALTGSNRRPSRCKRDALPTELSAPVREQCGIAWFSAVARGRSTTRVVLRAIGRLAAFRTDRCGGGGFSGLAGAIDRRRQRSMPSSRRMPLRSGSGLAMPKDGRTSAIAARSTRTPPVRRFGKSMIVRRAGLRRTGHVRPQYSRPNLPPGVASRGGRALRPAAATNYAAMRNLCRPSTFSRLN